MTTTLWFGFQRWLWAATLRPPLITPLLACGSCAGLCIVACPFFCILGGYYSKFFFGLMLRGACNSFHCNMQMSILATNTISATDTAVKSILWHLVISFIHPLNPFLSPPP